MKLNPIKNDKIRTIIAVIALAVATTMGRAATITTAGSGNWNSTTPNAPWPGGTVPPAGSDVVIATGNSVTNTATVSGVGSITIDSGGVLLMTGGPLTVTNFTLDSGGTFTPNSQSITFVGSIILNGTYNAQTSSGTTTLSGTGQTISGSTTLACNTLAMTGNCTNNGTVSFAANSGSGTLTQGANATLIDSQSNGSAPAFTLVATAVGNTVNYTGSGPAYKATAYQNLTLSGSGSAGQNWPTTSVNGTLTVSGSVSCPNISGTFGTLVVNDSSGSVTANNAITVSGTLTVSSGTFYAQSGLLTVSGTTTINGGILELGGSGAAFTGDFSMSSGTYNSSFSGQNPAVSFAGNLTVSGGTFTAGTGVHTFSGLGKTITGTISIPKLTVNGTCTNGLTLTVSTALAGSGTLFQAANSTLNIGGTSSSLTLNATANTPNTVAYIATGSQSVPGLTYNNLTFSGASTKTLTGATTVNSTLTISAGTLADGGFTLVANGNIVNNGTHSGVGQISLSGGSSTHSLTGTGAYQNLNLNDANGATIASGTATVNGTLGLTTGILGSSGGGLTLGNSATISRAAGSLSLTPTFGTSVNLIYNNTSATLTGLELPISTTVLNNLMINDAAGVTLNANATLKGTLTLTSGQLITGANLLTVTSTGTTTGASSGSYVNGTLSIGFSTGGGKSANFPIGDSSSYTPVSLASATVTTAGNLVASVTANVNSQGAYSSSGLDQVKYVNRDWTITVANGYAESTGSITLNFIPGDIQGGMSTAQDAVAKYSGGIWTHPTVTVRTSTNITVAGISSFSDWVVGGLPVPMFSGLTSKTIAYGSTNVILSGNLSANGGTAYPVNGSPVTANINGHSVNGTVTNSTGDFSIKYNDSSLSSDAVAGSPYTITYSFAGDANLLAATNDASTTLTVNPTALDITATNCDKTYGQTLNYGAGSTAFASTGLKNGETIGSVTVTADGGIDVTDQAGAYTLTPSAATGGTFSPNNYTITYNTGTLTVVPLAVELTGSRGYDGTTNADSTILAVNNIVGSDTVSVASGVGGLADAAVGTQAITSFGNLTLGNNAAGNYTLAGASGSVTITQANTPVAVASSQNPSLYGSNVTFTATLPAYATGEVIFETNGTALSTNIISDGMAASDATALLPLGTNTVTVKYLGDANDLGSTNSLADGQVVIGAPVIANSVTNAVPYGATWQIAITNLAAQAGWSDPNGFPLILTNVDALSVSGTNVTTDGTNIYYGGPVVSPDSFSYVISDGFLTATGEVYLVSATAQISNPTLNGNGNPAFSGVGAANNVYGVENATSLLGPWLEVTNLTVGPDGTWNFTDYSQTNPPIIFYRIYYPDNPANPPQ
jgi:hypothetical protein